MDRHSILITTMRADTAALAAAGSTADHHCGECGERVLLAPSSQELVKQRPEQCHVICLECLRGAAARGELSVASLGLAAPPERIAQEIDSAVPNTWRERN